MKMFFRKRKILKLAIAIVQSAYINRIIDNSDQVKDKDGNVIKTQRQVRAEYIVEQAKLILEEIEK